MEIMCDRIQSSAPLTGGEIDTVTVTASRESLENGTYNGTVQVTSNGGDTEISLEMRIDDPPSMVIEPVELDFGTWSTSETFTVTNTGGRTLNWETAETEDWITAVTPANGALLRDEVDTVTVETYRVGLAAGNYSGLVAVTSNGGSQDVTVEMEVEPYEMALNAGGGDYNDSYGYLWVADQAYSSGGYGHVGGHSLAAIVPPPAGTPYDGIYEVAREGMSAYRFDVQNGTYIVSLHFCEIRYTESGQRIMSFNVEGDMGRDDWDIYSEHGNNAVIY